MVEQGDFVTKVFNLAFVAKGAKLVCVCGGGGREGVKKSCNDLSALNTLESLPAEQSSFSKCNED